MSKAIVVSGIGALLLVSPLFISADTISDLQAQVQALLAQIERLQQQILSSTPSASASSNAASQCFSFTRDLFLDAEDRNTNGEVSKLQRFLIQAGVYPEARVTGYFGPATLRAVQRWQAQRGIVSSGDPDSTGYGFVGPRTRAAIARLCSQVLMPIPNVGANHPSTNLETPTTNLPTCTITANKTRVAPGEQFALSWVTNDYLKNPVMYQQVKGGGTVEIAASGSMQWTGEPVSGAPFDDMFQIGAGGLNAPYKSLCSVTVTIEPALPTPAPSITLSAPAGDSVLPVGSSVRIQWNSNNPGLSTRVALYIDVGSSECNSGFCARAIPGANNLPMSGTFDWTIGSVASPAEDNVALTSGPHRLRAALYDPQNGGQSVTRHTIPVTVVAKPALTPSCTITADKSSYAFGETATFSWTTSNATYATFVPDTSGKDNLQIPGDKLPANGSRAIAANVSGNPFVTLAVFNVDGQKATCTKTVSVAAPPLPAAVTPIHLVGVYEAQGTNHGFCYSDWGSIDVTIATDAISPLILALGSYEPVKWNITNPGKKKIEKIIFTGYHAQMAVGAITGVPIEHHSFFQTGKTEKLTSQTNDFFYKAGSTMPSRLYDWPTDTSCKTTSGAIPLASRLYFISQSDFAYASDSNDPGFQTLVSKVKQWAGSGSALGSVSMTYSASSFNVGGQKGLIGAETQLADAADSSANVASAAAMYQQLVDVLKQILSLLDR